MFGGVDPRVRIRVCLLLLWLCVQLGGVDVSLCLGRGLNEHRLCKSVHLWIRVALLWVGDPGHGVQQVDELTLLRLRVGAGRLRLDLKDVDECRHSVWRWSPRRNSGRVHHGLLLCFLSCSEGGRGKGSVPIVHHPGEQCHLGLLCLGSLFIVVFTQMTFQQIHERLGIG